MNEKVKNVLKGISHTGYTTEIERTEARLLIEDLYKENQQLKEQLQQKEDIINKAKEFAKEHIFQFDGDKDFDALLEILDNKGE